MTYSPGGYADMLVVSVWNTTGMVLYAISHFRTSARQLLHLAAAFQQTGLATHASHTV
jgi:hypothetical protein